MTRAAMPSKSWCVRDLLRVTTTYLKEKHVESPRLNAEVLLAHQLDLDRITLYLNFDQPLTDKELSGYRALVKRRVAREPLQYITGVQEFWSLNMTVCPDVLIPRPETEILVDHALGLARDMEHSRGTPLKIAEPGTGCGAVAIALAGELPKAVIQATDVSRAALKVARQNAVTHGVSENIVFTQGDLYGNCSEAEDRFDLIVSNPPYVATPELADLPPEVRDYEPQQALAGGADGMHFLKQIIHGGPALLNSGGWLVLEMAPHQTERVLGLIDQTQAYHQKKPIKDYSGRYRVVQARRD